MSRRRSTGRRNSMPRMPGLPRVPGFSRAPTAVRIALTILVVLAGLLGTWLKTKDRGHARTPTPSTTQSDRTREPRAPRSVPAGDILSGLVTHVADGDTIEVDFDDSAPPVRIRLLGIDTPEMSEPTAALGSAAREWTRRTLDHQRVSLRFDGPTPKYDKYDRMLAYVFLSDGSFVNEALVLQGQAFAHRTLTCGRTPQLVAAEDDARAARRGFWPAVSVEQMPEWRQRWLSQTPRR